MNDFLDEVASAHPVPAGGSVTAHTVAARVMAVFAIRVQPLRSLQNDPTPSSHRSGPARIIP